MKNKKSKNNMNHSTWIDLYLLIEDEAEQALNSIHYCLVNQWDHEFDVETQCDRFLKNTKTKYSISNSFIYQ